MLRATGLWGTEPKSVTETLELTPSVVLDAHQRLRTDGQALVSVLAAPSATAAATWGAWAASNRLRLVIVPGSDPEALSRLVRLRRIRGPAALLFRPGPGTEAYALEASQIAASRFSTWPVGLALAPRAAAELLAIPRWTALVSEGLIPLQSPAGTRSGPWASWAPSAWPYRSAYEELAHRLLSGHPDVEDSFECNVRVRGASGVPYEVDLFCRSRKLALEIDGLHHLQDPQQKARDQKRDADLEEEGILTLRIHAHQVTKDPSGFIKAALQALTQRP